MLFKIIRLIFYILSGAILLIVILLSISSLLYTAPKVSENNRLLAIEKYENLAMDEDLINSLKDTFEAKKLIPIYFEKQIIIALSHFTELKNAEVDFLIKETNFPLLSYPDPLSLLIPGKPRKYIIVISSNSLPEYEEILLKNLPFDAQIGVIGHELAHSSFYQKKSNWELAWIGIKYVLSSSYRTRFERLTDELTIDHGLGHQLLSWRRYYENLELSREKAEKSFYFEDRYLTAEEIEEKMEELK